MMVSKGKKRTGWRTPNFTIKGKFSDLIQNCLEPQKFWDEWNDPRDGFRWVTDRAKILKYKGHRQIDCRQVYWLYSDLNVDWDKKNKKLLKRRSEMKWKQSLK